MTSGPLKDFTAQTSSVQSEDSHLYSIKFAVSVHSYIVLQHLVVKIVATIVSPPTSIHDHRRVTIIPFFLNTIVGSSQSGPQDTLAPACTVPSKGKRDLKLRCGMCRATFSVNPYCGHISRSVADFKFCIQKDVDSCLDRRGQVIEAFSIQTEDEGQYCRQCQGGLSLPTQNFAQFMQDIRQLGKNMTRSEWLSQECALKGFYPNFTGFTSNITGHISWEDWSRSHGGVHALYAKRHY